MNVTKAKSTSKQLNLLFLVLLIPLVGAMILAFLIGALSAIGIGLAFTLINAIGWYIDFRVQRSFLRFALIIIIATLFGYTVQLFSLQWFGTPNWPLAILSLLVIALFSMIEMSLFCTKVLQPRLTQPHHDTGTDPVTSTK